MTAIGTSDRQGVDGRRIVWLVPKGQKTAHAFLRLIGKQHDEFWCGIVRGQYEVRFPRKGELRCKRCIAFIRNSRKATSKGGLR